MSPQLRSIFILSCLALVHVNGHSHNEDITNHTDISQKEASKSERKLHGITEEVDIGLTPSSSSSSMESGEQTEITLVANQLEHVEGSKSVRFNDTCDYNTADECYGNTTLLICNPDSRCECFSYVKFLTYPESQEEEESLEKEEKIVIEALNTEWNSGSERCEGQEGSICSTTGQTAANESLYIVPFCKAGLVCKPDLKLQEVMTNAGRCT